MIDICKRGLAACLILAAAAACQPVRNPATGEINYTSLSPEEEIELGRQEDRNVRAEFGGSYDDPELASYIDRIGQDLVAVSELPDLEFTFTVLDSPVVNAFALPGGFVYISRGLLVLAENEAEVAGVIGHEIGHVTARHTAQRYDRAVAGQVGTQIAGVLGTVLGGYYGGPEGARAGGQLFGQAAGLGAQAWVQGFSREQEFQSDQLGVRYLTRAGYDPHGMSSFLGALQANDELQRKKTGSAAVDSVPSWLSSHPRTADRVERAADEAAVEMGNGGRTERDALLAAIDGMIYGENPAQGIVIDGRFVHPDLRFAFRPPEGMKVVNTPTFVAARDDRRQMKFDFGRSADSDLRRYLQDEWTREIRLERVERVRFDGRDGATGFVRGKAGNRDVEAMFAAMDGPQDRVYRFMFFALGRISAEDLEDFEDVLRSLDDLSAAEAAAVRPLVVRIMTVEPGQGIDDFTQMMAVNGFERDLFLTINGLTRGRRLQAGEKVKVIVRG